jgi:hypothetical protein
MLAPMSEGEPSLDAVRQRVRELLNQFRAIHADNSRSVCERLPEEIPLIEEMIKIASDWQKNDRAVP